MIYYPGHSKELQKHIDHYWIVKETSKYFELQHKLLAFPGVTPDLLIVLNGCCKSLYMGNQQTVQSSHLYSFIHDKVSLDISELKAFVLIKFKSRGLSSLLPFIKVDAQTLIQNSVVTAEHLFGSKINLLVSHLRNLTEAQIALELDGWLQSLFCKEREGFMIDLAEDITEDFNLKEIRSVTNYSYSTLERYFKRDTGLRPKKFQSLNRYKKAVREICTTENTNWSDYVQRYGYFDQSHFIKEIKRYTSFTPSQLAKVPSFVKYRPA